MIALSGRSAPQRHQHHPGGSTWTHARALSPAASGPPSSCPSPQRGCSSEPGPPPPVVVVTGSADLDPAAPLFTDTVTAPVVLDGAEIAVPRGPGTGAEIDADALDRLTVSVESVGRRGLIGR